MSQIDEYRKLLAQLEDDCMGGLVGAMESDLEEHLKWRHALCEAIEATYQDAGYHGPIVSCPWCGGDGTDGYDRCLPPNPYICSICNGSGEVEICAAGETKIEAE